MQNKEVFKICPMCQTVWETREVFLGDPSLELEGYQADFEKLEYGLFYFTHKISHCRSTLAIPASQFLDLYEGPRYPERRTGEEECPSYCLDQNQLDRCDAFCECAFVREVIHIIRQT